MKKFFSLVMLLVLCALTLSACGPKDAIMIAPHDLNMPDTYQIKYTFVVDAADDSCDEFATIVCGCDAAGNYYYSYTSENKVEKRLCIGSDDSYNQYSFNQETGKYELVQEGCRWVSAFVFCNEYVEYANDIVTDKVNGGKKTYEKIDALSELPSGVSGAAIDFSDPERFEYFVVKGRVYEGGAGFEGFETVVEKETGACVYVKFFGFENLTGGADTECYIYATEYLTPYSGSYGNYLTN